MDTYREIAPPPELSSRIEAFWFREGGERTDSHRVLPDGCIDILLVDRPGAPDRRFSLSVVGPMTRFIDVRREPGEGYVGVRFRPGAAPAVLGVSAHEIVDASPALEDLWGARASILLDRLAECESAPARVDLLRTAVAVPGTRALDMDPRVAAAVGLLRHSFAEIRIESLAAAVGVSSRQLRRLFLESVGLSPKQLHRILRLRSILDTARKSPPREPPAWSAISLDAGYYDQAHFVNDFRSWTGASPTRYLAAP